MIGAWLLAWSLVLSGSFEADLALALRDSPLTGTAFHRTVLETMKAHSLVVPYSRSKQGPIARTLVDDSARIVWGNAGYNRTGCDQYVIWREKEALRVQKLPRPQGEDSDWVLFEPPVLRGDELVQCGDASAEGNWSRPNVRIYANQGGKWELEQSLFPGDAMSAQGTTFLRRHGTIDPNVVVSMTRVYPKYLNAAHVGPLLIHDLRFTRSASAFKQTLDQRRETPLATLEDLSRAYVADDKRSFDALVPPALRSAIWNVLLDNPRGEPWVSTTSNFVRDDSPSLVLGDTLQIEFEKRGSRWVPSSVKRRKKSH
ncbi:MAG: hypothetical protein M9921_15600 [Fimbriimonadaceae bacterium]|nr:hypothetical protein [Fimbriimonadaceae bacterium]